jgi:hypothetical protein
MSDGAAGLFVLHKVISGNLLMALTHVPSEPVPERMTPIACNDATFQMN